MNKTTTKVFTTFGVASDSPQWQDWHWQYAHRICDVAGLSQIIDLSEADKNEITECLKKFRMAISPYYASLIDADDHNDPIYRQAIPSGLELEVYPWEMADPLDEEGASPNKDIIHRYPDRALFFVTECCAMYCRHCTRRRFNGESDRTLAEADIEEALAYLRAHREIRDVLVSGGDPLTLSDDVLESIIKRIRAIEHIEIIRIGTRTPVTLPMRITPELLTMLKKYQPLWINTHFNHPKELSPEAIRACESIVDAGFPLGNQSVLLKGINDDPQVMKELLLDLVKHRIRPYYLYQCDLVEGLEHFRTDVRSGITLMKGLIGNISGLAIPTFVIDAPGGGGKIPIGPNYLVSLDDNKAVLDNYLDQRYEYPQPQSLSSKEKKK